MVRTAIQGKNLRGTLSSTVKATDFTLVQKSEPETRVCIYINPIILLLVVTVSGGKKHGADKHSAAKHGSGKKVRRWEDFSSKMDAIVPV